MWDRQRVAWERFYRLRGQAWSRSHDIWFPTDESWLLLDLGCGSGKSCELLECNVVAVDFSREALRLLGRNHHRVHTVCCDIVSLPFRDQAFDIVHASFALGHLTEEARRLAVSEALRVLVMNGLFAVELFSMNDGRCQRSSRDREATVADGEDIFHHFFDLEEVRTMLAAFDIIEIGECNWQQRTGERSFMSRCSIRSLARKRPS